MVAVYPVGISPKRQNDKSLIINIFRNLARYASHSGDIAFKEIEPENDTQKRDKYCFFRNMGLGEQTKRHNF